MSQHSKRVQEDSPGPSGALLDIWGLLSILNRQHVGRTGRIPGRFRKKGGWEELLHDLSLEFWLPNSVDKIGHPQRCPELSFPKVLFLGFISRFLKVVIH
jgi:hypothetical protein